MSLLLIFIAQDTQMLSALQTNNPRKINELTSLGLVINGRIPCIAETSNEHNEVCKRLEGLFHVHIIVDIGCYFNSGEILKSMLAFLLNIKAALKASRTKVVMPNKMFGRVHCWEVITCMQFTRTFRMLYVRTKA